VVPHAMGAHLGFYEGEGPKLEPVRDERSIKKLTTDIEEKLQPIARSLKLTRQELAADKTLIGFAGAPWTVAAYMVEGGGSNDFSVAACTTYKNPQLFSTLIKKISDATLKYLFMQVRAGVDVVMLFDSWAGLLPQEEFKRWVIEPTATLVKKFKEKHPHVSVIA